MSCEFVHYLLLVQISLEKNSSPRVALCGPQGLKTMEIQKTKHLYPPLYFEQIMLAKWKVNILKHTLTLLLY